MLISALMITGKSPERRPFAQVAVECFRRQICPWDTELVAINTAPDAPWFDGVREICVPQGDKTLGHLRNLSHHHAHGELTIQWDDDDWHHPERILTQVGDWSGHGAQVLHSQYRLDILTGESFVLMGGIHGTVLCPKGYLDYPHEDKGEDTLALLKGHWTVLDNNPNMYVRTYNRLNTWDRTHIMGDGTNHPRIKREVDDQFIESIRRIYRERTA